MFKINRWGTSFRKFIEENGGNRTVLALSVARLGDAVGNSIVFIVVPLYVAKIPSPLFQFSETIRVGILIALFGVVTALLQPLMGALSDYVGRRKIFIQAGLLLMAFSSLGYVIANRYSQLLIFRTFQGLGVALTVPAAVALLATSSNRQTRGGSMGIYTAFRMAGLAIGPLLGGFVYDRYGFNVAFYLGTGFILIGIILVQLWIRDLPKTTSQKEQKQKRSFQILNVGLLSGGIVGASFASLIMAGAFSMITTLEKQFNQRLDQTALGFGLAISALTISRLIFQIPLGRWSDQIGRKPLIIGGLLLMAPATVVLGYVGSTFQLTAARVFQGIASAGIAAPAFAVAADLAPRGGEGQQMSFITVGFGLGIGLGPLLAGVLAVYFFQLPFIVMGVLCLLAAWVVLRYVPETVSSQNAKDEPLTEEEKDQIPLS